MGKLAILVIIIFLGVLALFSIVNTDMTTINIPFGTNYEIPKIGLILASSVAGALAMLVIFMIRDTKRYMVTYQFQKQKKKEDRIHAHYTKAMNSILAEDVSEARDHLEEILKEEPSYHEALMRLGDLARDDKSLDEAVGYYRRALSTAPKSLEALFSLEGVLEKMGKWAEAMNCLEEILELDTDNLSALQRKRAVLERDGKWDDVIDVQKTILKHTQSENDKQKEQFNMLGYRYELARDSLEKGEVEKANKGFRNILREDKNFIPAYLGIAEALLADNESESAVSFLEKGYEQTLSQILLARLEDLLINLGEPSRLIRIFSKAISENPQNNMLKFFLGKLYFRLEMIDDAFEILSSLEADETFPELFRLMADLYMRRDQCKEAVEEFKKTLKDKVSYKIPYCCGVCGYKEADWSGRCPECHNWSTYRFDIHGACKA